MDEDMIKDILMYTVTGGTLKMVQNHFDQQKVTVNKILQDESFFDYDLLKAALQRNHISIVNFLLKLDCRVQNPNKISKEETPFHLAMKLGNIAIIKKIFKQGFVDKNVHNINTFIRAKDRNENTPLYAAFVENNYHAVHCIFDTYHFNDIDPSNKDDVIHFNIACVVKHHPTVKHFLKAKFDVNSPFALRSTKYSGVNPLHYTISEKDFWLFEYFLNFNGDLSVKDSKGRTPLHALFYDNKLIEMRHLAFRCGNDSKYTNCVDSNNLSHFHLSCMEDNCDHVQKFLDKGVDINSALSLDCPIYPGFTPLHFAIMFKCEKVIDLLLKNGADRNKTNKEGETPLHLAYRSIVSCKIVQMLLDYKVCTTAVDKKGCTPLHVAFYNDFTNFENPKIFDMIMQETPREINYTDNQGLSHFHIACTRNDVSRVNDFLRSGVVLNSCVVAGKFSGYTGLHFATLYNQKDVVEILLKRNAQVNIARTKTITPLHLACGFNCEKFYNLHSKYNWSVLENFPSTNTIDWISNEKNQFDIIDLLLLHKAKVNAEDSLGETPLLHTCNVSPENYFYKHWYYPFRSILKKEISNRLKKVVGILLSNEANVNAARTNNQSILHIITRNKFFEDSEELIELLIRKGADVDAADNDGLTPLHVAVKYQKLELVQIFLKFKANINAKTKDSSTPLYLQIKEISHLYSVVERNKIFCVLLKNGSDVNTLGGNGKTPLHVAIASLRIFMIEKLLEYGADINIEDFSGNLSISSLSMWKPELSYLRHVDISYAQVFKILFVHIQKLLALKLHVNEKVMRLCTKLHETYNAFLIRVQNVNPNDSDGLIDLNNVYDECIQELDKMKFTKIDNYTSLYCILVKNAHDLSKYARNSRLIEILNDQNIDENFPFYSYLLKLKYKISLTRSKLLEHADVSLSFAIALNLPDICLDSILKNLTNEEVANLKVAVPLRNTFKRKINDVSEEESPAKMQKKD